VWITKIEPDRGSDLGTFSTDTYEISNVKIDGRTRMTLPLDP
jgi:hypothetical protein